MWALSTFLPGHLQDLPPPCSRGFVSEPPGRGLQWVWVQGPRGTEPLRPPRAPAEPEEGCGEGDGQVVGLHLKEPRGRAVWHCSHPPWGSSRAGAAGAGLAERAQATGRHPLRAAGSRWPCGLTCDPHPVPPARVSTPHYSPGLLIERNDAYTKVYSRAGLALMWNREDSLMVGGPTSWALGAGDASVGHRGPVV